MRGYILSSIVLGALSVSAQRCKCLPGDDCFPSADEWQAFADTLSQPLLTDQRPLGAACYQESEDFDAALCAQYREGLSTSFIVEHPNTLMFGNNEGLITETEVQNCPLDASVSVNGTCFQGRVPSYLITATTVEDIQNTIVFATEHDLHLVVRNTGYAIFFMSSRTQLRILCRHEFIGRAFGIGAVELYTHNFQGIEFSDSFVPQGAPADIVGQDGTSVHYYQNIEG